MATYVDYLMFVNSCRNHPAYSDQRFGQLLMNVLFDYNQALYWKVSEQGLTQINPFYNDDHIPAFLDFIYENWAEYAGKIGE